jgi:hypothetical protein
MLAFVAQLLSLSVELRAVTAKWLSASAVYAIVRRNLAAGAATRVVVVMRLLDRIPRSGPRHTVSFVVGEMTAAEYRLC